MVVSAETVAHAVKLRQNVQIKLSSSSSGSVLSPGQPVPSLTQHRHASDIAATRRPIVLVLLDRIVQILLDRIVQVLRFRYDSTGLSGVT